MLKCAVSCTWVCLIPWVFDFGFNDVADLAVGELTQRGQINQGYARAELRRERVAFSDQFLVLEPPRALAKAIHGPSDDHAAWRHCRTARQSCQITTRFGTSTWRMRTSTRSMTSSGVEVPAVSPTTFAASNHSGWTSASVCT
jgi:hypothetical protein